MRALTAARPLRNQRTTSFVIGVGASGCILALAVGALTVTHYGAFAGGLIVAIEFLTLATVAYFKDPILAFMGLWLFELLDPPLSAVFGYNSGTGQSIRQADEVLVLLFVLLTIWRTLRSDIKMPSLLFVAPGFGVALFGFLGAVVHNVPSSTALVGALLGLKFWIILGAALLLPWTTKDLKRVYSTVMVVGLIVAALGFLDYLTHGGVSRALHTSNYNVNEGGYRSEAVHSIFPTPGEYSLFMSLLFGISFSRFTSKYTRSDLALALLFAGSVMLSLRLKGILSLAAVIAIVGAVQIAASGRRAIIASVFGLLLIGGAYALEGSVITKQVSTYTSSESSTRARLYGAGDQIAADNFPIGVGFGRFASYPSRTSYSPVYYQYRLNGVYGLSPRYPDFIDDTSWPSVIGETGYGGFLIYAAGVVVLILAAASRLKAAPDSLKWLPLAALCSIAVLLVDSLGDPSLFSWLATTTVAMVVGPTLVLIRSRNRQI
jgi:hypothetical protein